MADSNFQKDMEKWSKYLPGEFIIPEKKYGYLPKYIHDDLNRDDLNETLASAFTGEEVTIKDWMVAIYQFSWLAQMERALYSKLLPRARLWMRHKHPFACEEGGDYKTYIEGIF